MGGAQRIAHTGIARGGSGAGGPAQQNYFLILRQGTPAGLLAFAFDPMVQPAAAWVPGAVLVTTGDEGAPPATTARRTGALMLVLSSLGTAGEVPHAGTNLTASADTRPRPLLTSTYPVVPVLKRYWPWSTH